MGTLCYRRDTCRLCGSRDLVDAFRLTPTPPANAFVPVDTTEEQEAFPLEVVMCATCSHVQLHHVVDARLLFEHYVYVSGTSPVFVDHFRRYAQDVLSRYQVPRDGLVVDIGSNDGTLLRAFQESGRRVLGIDPAVEIAQSASRAGIETLATFFTSDVARSIRSERGPAAVVTANNVFAHIDDLGGVADAIAELLRDNGVFLFEVSYLRDVYEKTLFDTIYHEHLDYHTVKPLSRFLGLHGLQLIDVERIDTHGGSIRATAQTIGGPRTVSRRVRQLIDEEQILGLDRSGTLRTFGARIDELGVRLRELLLSLRRRGEHVAGFGAPAKATTLMYHFGLGRDIIDFIVDDSPLKQGLLTPGLHVPVLPVQTIYDRRPENVLVLAWNFASSITAKHQAFVASGGRMIVPLPQLEVISS